MPLKHPKGVMGVAFPSITGQVHRSGGVWTWLDLIRGLTLMDARIWVGCVVSKPDFSGRKCLGGRESPRDLIIVGCARDKDNSMKE